MTIANSKHGDGNGIENVRGFGAGGYALARTRSAARNNTVLHGFQEAETAGGAA